MFPSRLAASVPALLAALALSGCAFAPSQQAAAPAASAQISGRIHGGQQPVVGASLQFYTVGTTGDGSTATSILSQAVTSDANGNFSIAGIYSCTGASLIYAVGTGGNPGLSAANPNLSLLAAVGSCSTLNSSTFINIDEVTTVAAAYALAPYIGSVNPASSIGSASTDVAALTSAFTLASQLANTATGTAPGLNIPTGYTPPTAALNALADSVAACINSTGGIAGDSSPCGNLFSATSVSGSTPVEPILALRNLALHPTQNTLPIYNISTSNGPFQPQLATPPPDWRIRLTQPASSMALQLSASSLTFPTTGVGLPSSTQTVTLQNTSTSTISLSSIALSGINSTDFAQSTPCGATLQALASCTIQVAITPAAAGSRSGYLGVSSSTIDSPQYIALAGTGAAGATGPQLSLSSTSLAFTQAAESTSAAQTVTVNNTGTASLSVSAITFTGSNSPSFTETDNCSGTIAPSSNCVISVSFTPFLAATHAATMSIASNAGIPQTVALSGTGTGTLAINTSNSTKWVITNGAMTYEFNPTTGNVTAVYYANNSAYNLVDTTTTSNGYPDGLYMDNTGQGSGTISSGYSLVANKYLDWWVSVPSSSSNAFTYTQHFVTTANDTGFHVYSTVGHSATDIAGSIGQWQYVFRIDLNKFVYTYTVNEGLNNPGVQVVPLPSSTVTGNTDPGRQVSNAVVDIHGLTIPSGFIRSFYTKYDYSSYEYLHTEHGLYGSQYGAWTVLPSTESFVGGPSKQDLIFTGNILMIEALSSHFDNNLVYTPAQGVASTRLFGPYYYHFNQFTSTLTTADQLYAEAQNYLPAFSSLYDNETTLATYGYVPSTGRGSVTGTITNGGSATANTAWAVLADNAENFQYSSNGYQYWVPIPASGQVTFTGVAPGTYRLSSYVLGKWGELRKDNIVVTANNTTVLPALTFTQEAFGPSAPIWTIGTPDRSAHEFLHGEDANGYDLRNFWGAYNFWSDFASTSGTQTYYATAVGATPATNNLAEINYVQWGTFDPGLFGGVYSGSDDTTDGYNYVIPSYVASLSGATGTNGVGTAVPPLTIHFTTNATQKAQGSYAILSVALACTENDVIAYLNGHELIYYGTNPSDCMVRSGLSGYYQWVALQWPSSDLTAAGSDNVLTLASNHAEGVSFDALRFEITSSSAQPSVTGYNDYIWVTGTSTSSNTAANDAIPNN